MTFTLNGELNHQYWATRNPHWICETHTQNPQQVNVWTVIITDRILRLIVIDGNVTKQIYLEFLHDELFPTLAVMYPNSEDTDILNATVDITNATVWYQ